MLKNERFKIYKRLSILTVLSISLFMFSFPDDGVNVQAGAAPCMQDCDRYSEMCNDSCQGACEDTDEACENCLTNCGEQWNYCLQHSIYCTSGSVEYSPSCSLQFGLHCMVNTGVEDCTGGGVHDGYSLVCTRIGYQDGCVVCPDPDDENCYGSGGPGSGPPQCL